MNRKNSGRLHVLVRAELERQSGPSRTRAGIGKTKDAPRDDHREASEQHQQPKQKDTSW